MRNVRAYLFLIQFAVVDGLYGQATLEWSRRYAGRPRGTDAALAVAVDDSGNVVVTGASENSNLYLDIATVKYSRSGQQLWVSRFNELSNADARGYDIAIGISGDTYVAGNTVIRYSVNGDTLWVKRFAGTFSGMEHVVANTQGCIYATGGRSADYMTKKYDSTGNEIWSRYLNGRGNSFDLAYNQRLDKAGNIIVTGRMLDTIINNRTDYVIGTAKYSPLGDTIWIRYYHGPQMPGYHAGYGIAVDDSANVYIVGESDVAEFSPEIVVIKYVPNGDERWVSRYRPPGSSGAAYDIAVDSIGNVYVVGVTGCCTFTVLKLNSLGQLQWTSNFANRFLGIPLPKLALDNQRNIYVAATQDRQPWSDYVLAKYNSAGTQLWRVTYPGSGTGFNELRDMTLDRDNNIYLTGEGANDYLTLKFSQTPAAVRSVERVPTTFALHQNYPNPFNPTTTIQFDLPTASTVNLEVVDLLGREVAKIVDDKLSAGRYERTFDASLLASGVYFYRLEASEFVETRKMIIMR